MNTAKLRLAYDSEDREEQRRRERTPRAQALLNQGRDLLETVLDEQKRHRILDAMQVPAGFVFFGREDIPEEAAECIRRILERASE